MYINTHVNIYLEGEVMISFNLINIFNGFIRNYGNFGLTRKSNNFEVIKTETKYFVILGQMLGYSVIYKGLNQEEKINKVEVLWNDYNNDISKLNSTRLQILRETDLSTDLEAVQHLLSNIKKDPNRAVIQVIETFSKSRIDYINNIINTSLSEKQKDILLIYVIRDILNSKNYYKAYLFENGKATKSKSGTSYCDVDGKMKAIFTPK